MATPVDKAAAAAAAPAPPPPMMPVSNVGGAPQMVQQPAGMYPGAASGYPPQAAYAPGAPPPPGFPGVQPGAPGGMMMPGGGPPRPNLPPELIKAIKTASIVNFALTMAQLLMSLAIVIIVRESLESVTVVPAGGGDVRASYVCYLEPSGGGGGVVGASGSSCAFAYGLASTSIFACFFLSLMQCLTVDCCGNGRMVETLFDFLLFMWWTAGAITLTVAKNAADAVGTPESGARQAVVTLSWFSAIFFLMLGCTNAFLTAKLAKAKKLAMAQQQQQLGQGLAVSPFAPAFGGHQYVPPGATVVYAPQQPMAGGVPAGYPGAMAPGQPQQWQQQQPAPVVAGAPAAVAAAATQPPTA